MKDIRLERSELETLANRESSVDDRNVTHSGARV